MSAIDLKGFGGFGSLFGQTSSEYTVRRARYAKGQALVQVKSTGGMKGRAARLLHALKCKFVNREGGYSCSPSKLAKFVKATDAGWDWAVKNQAEAVDIVLKNDTSGAQKKDHQTSMMKEIARLVEGSKKGTGYLDPADYKRTVDIVLENKVISKAPTGAYTHAVWDSAMMMK